MESARYLINGRLFMGLDDRLQAALSAVYGSSERPRCLCVPSGVEMYVAQHGEFLIKRMPGTGRLHHASCPAFEPEPGMSGLGELLGQAIIEHDPERIELRTAFPLDHRNGRAVAHRDETAQELAAGSAPGKMMSLRGLLHFLYDRAGFNRWYPAMEGKRSHAVIRHHLLAAAHGVTLKGAPLEERLFIPEQFRATEAQEIADRRRQKLAMLACPDARSRFKMAILIGQFNTAEATAYGRRITVKHMPDAPLYIDNKVWERAERAFSSLLQAMHADLANRPRVLMAALIYAKREHLYQVDSLTLMLVSPQWLPLEGLHELPLIEMLVREGRAFLKPLKFDSKASVVIPNVLLLDAGAAPVCLHVMSTFQSEKERSDKERAFLRIGEGTWLWKTDTPIPPLPEVSRS